MDENSDITTGVFAGMTPSEVALISLGYYEALLLENNELRDAYIEQYGADALDESWLMLITGLLMLISDGPSEMYEVIDKARQGLIALDANL